MKNPSPSARSTRRVVRSSLALATVGLLACSCSDEVEDNPDVGADVSSGDVAVDSGAADTGVDATPDVGIDVTVDAAPDGTPDVLPDVTQDGGVDVEPDVPPDISEGPLELTGEWFDNFEGSHWILDDRWQMGWGPTASVFAVSDYSNAEQWIIAQNDIGNSFNPELWSRFDWTVDADDQTWFCQTVFDATTEEDALLAAPADTSDLEVGCNGFAWSVLTPGQGPLAIQGVFVDNFDGSHWIQEDRWQMGWGPEASEFTFESFNNIDRSIIGQNGADNAFNPDLFSRFDWTWDDAGDLYFCQSAFAAATADDARSATPADSDDLDAGCGGFSWSQLTPGEGTIAVVGTWSTSGAERLTITDTDWTKEVVDSGTFVSTFVEVSNTGRYVIGEEVGLGFDRHEWTWDVEGNLYYCKTALRLPTVEDVEAEPFADPSNPAVDGCEGGPWTALIAD